MATETTDTLTDAEWLRRELLPIQYVPVTPTPRQFEFLLDPHEEVLYGGSSGGGKTFALLMAALQWITKPGYHALILRRAYPDLAQPGSHIPTAMGWLGSSDARWDGTQHRWAFPSGATLSFGYLESENDRFRYQSSNFHAIFFDELTEFREVDYRFLFSRLRRVEGSKIPLRVRAASNPGGRYGEWVKQRFIDSIDPDRAFIPARLSDNPHLDAEAYVRSLNRLDPVTRRQLLEGDWTARQSGGVFRREKIPVLDVAPHSWHKVRAWDLAGSEGGDYTVGALVSYGKDPLPNGGWCVEHVVRGRWTPADRDAVLLQTARVDGGNVRIVIEQEGGSGGIAQVESLKRTLSGYSVMAVRPTGDKLTRAGPVATQAGVGRVSVVRGPWLSVFLDELEAFPDSEHDDAVDALAYGWAALPQSIRQGEIGIAVPDRGRTVYDELGGMSIGGGR